MNIVVIFKKILRRVKRLIGLKPVSHPDFYTEIKSPGVSFTKRAVKLIITLTSYPGRINYVHQTITTLLNQSLKPDMVVLWLSKEEFPGGEKDLPGKLKKLQAYGLTIQWYDKNLKPYLKLVPSLKAFPNDILVTADDDMYYEPFWLEKLYVSYLKEPDAIHCHRAHRVRFSDGGKVLPYLEWENCYAVSSCSYLNFLTGIGGVLYPPNSLFKDVTREDLFLKLSPTGDDIWFWAMALLNKTPIRIIKDFNDCFFDVNQTQETSLYAANRFEGKNDLQINNVLSYYPGLQTILSEATLKQAAD